MAATAHGKKIELTAFLPGEWPTQLRGDPNRLRQILINLIGNAIKFTSEGGSVEILGGPLFQDAHTLELMFEVRDNGIGIPEEQRHLVFERFTQVDDRTERRFAGTGLGLAICRDLVTMMGGTLDVAAQTTADSGSIFYFTVRLHRQPRAQTGPAQTTKAAAPKPLQGVRALVIASTGVQLAFLNHALQTWGAHGKSVHDIKTATDIVQRDPYDLLIVNQKPGDTLPKALDDLHAARGNARLVVLRDLLAQDTHKTGALSSDTLFLKKPFAIEQALPKIAQLLQRDITERRQPERRPVISRSERLQTATILLVDDQIANLKITRSMLTRLGCPLENIRCVSDGRQAVEWFQKEAYDLVLMDCQMPIMDGYQASRLIRTWEKAQERPATPIIAFTADVTMESRAQGVLAGMSDFLSKPVFLKPLQSMLDTHILFPAALLTEPSISAMAALARNRG